MQQPQAVRNDWTIEEVRGLYNLPFNDLLLQAHQSFRANFDANEVQASTLLNIKTGGCPEDCKYCSQSVHNPTSLAASKLMDINEIRSKAQQARQTGATRFCMGAAWRNLKERDTAQICSIIQEVKALGMETCMTLGMLTETQAVQLKEAGLDYYNHNIDTSRDYYDKVITTRNFDDRLQTLEHVRAAGMKVCCGGILGMGETVDDRLSMLHTLATLPQHPESVPINQLIAVPGTPMAQATPIAELDFVRIIAVARILMPRSYVRLSAGREEMNDSMQALCFFAGANSIFYGETLLTQPNPAQQQDNQLLEKLGIEKQKLMA